MDSEMDCTTQGGAGPRSPPSLLPSPLSAAPHVKFNDRVKVREIEKGEKGLAYVNDQGYKVSNHAGLGLKIVRQYSETLAAAKYSPMSPPLPGDLSDLPSFGAGGLAGNNAPLHPPISSPPQPQHGAGVLVASPPPAPPRRLTFSGWHIKQDGCVYHGPSNRTSMVVNIQGNCVTTAHGSTYYLLDVDGDIARVMNLIVSSPRGPFTVVSTTGLPYPPFDQNDPLNPKHVPLLFLAERIVYGDLSERKNDIIAALEVMTSLYGVLDAYLT